MSMNSSIHENTNTDFIVIRIGYVTVFENVMRETYLKERGNNRMIKTIIQ
jgi:hypothetical protein